MTFYTIPIYHPKLTLNYQAAFRYLAAITTSQLTFECSPKMLLLKRDGTFFNVVSTLHPNVHVIFLQSPLCMNTSSQPSLIP